MIRSYDELSELTTFEERYRYLSLRGVVGASTFGFDRWVNQRIRDYVITRDEGCDLGILGHEIHDRLYIHHMNPMSLQDITEGDPRILDLNNLITCTHQTHNAIHYGDESKLAKPLVERRPGDTKLW